MRISPRPKVSSRAALGLLGTLVLACGAQEAPARSWPPGTVLAMDGNPIGVDEVDQAAGWVALLEPQATPLQLRRLALANHVFPRYAARRVADDERARALEEARSYIAAIEADGEPPSGPVSGPSLSEITGSWPEIGMAAWATAIETGPARWSGIVEAVGVFHIVRLESTSRDDPYTVTVSRIDFPFVPMDFDAQDLELALDGSKLSIVDPSWRDTVPTNWIYRLDGGSS